MAQLYNPVTIDINDFIVYDFKEHTTLGPLLAYMQAVHNSNSAKKPDRLIFTKKSAIVALKKSVKAVGDNAVICEVSYMHFFKDMFNNILW